MAATTDAKKEETEDVTEQWKMDAQAMLAKDDPGTAARILKALIAKDPTNAEYHYQLGFIARVKWNNYEQAKEEFELAVKHSNNKHVLAVFGLAMLYKNNFQDYGASEKYFNILFESTKTWGVAYKEFGDLLGYRLNKWDEAVKQFENSFKFDHFYLWNAYNNAAWGCANKLNDFKKAEEYYRKSIETHPNNITYANWGKLYMDFLNDDKKAEECFRESLKLVEKTRGAHVFLGQVLAKRGANDLEALQEAKKHLTRSIELGDTRGKKTLEEIIQNERKQDEASEQKDKEDAAVTTGASGGSSTGDEKDEKEKGGDSKEDKKQLMKDLKANFVVNMLNEPTEALMATNDHKILCCGDQEGNISLYDLTSLKKEYIDAALQEEDAANSDEKEKENREVLKYTFYSYNGRNCNEIQFSHDDKYLAAAFFDEKSRTSDLLIFDISSITSVESQNSDEKKINLNDESIKGCNKPFHNLTLSNKINTNAMHFSKDSKKLFIGLAIYYPIHVPFYSVNIENSCKLETDVFSNILLKEGYQIANNESVTAIDVQSDMLCIGTSLGHVFIIDLSMNKLLFGYNHRETTAVITAIMITSDMKWVISSDIYGAMNFYHIILKTDKNFKEMMAAGNGHSLVKMDHKLVADARHLMEFSDKSKGGAVHFRTVSELQCYNNKLVCSASHDGNVALFELVNNDFYSNTATVRVLSRVESSHNYLAINTTSWIMTDIGLCLFTGGDDKLILLHGFTDILLSALPTEQDIKKHMHHGDSRRFDINDVKGTQNNLQLILFEEKQKLNGWINLWAYNTLSRVNAASVTETATRDMVIAALGALNTMTEPIVLNLIEDKYKYEIVFKKLLEDETDSQGLAMINKLFDETISKSGFYNNGIQQPDSDIITLMTHATHANKELQRYAMEFAQDPVVSGMYEGDPGIKKLKRVVEKTLLKNLQSMDTSQEKTKGRRVSILADQLDFSFLKDLARAGITCRDMKSIHNVLKMIIKNKSNELEIVRMKNRFIPESELGYRDILLNLRFIKEVKKDPNDATKVIKEYKYNGHIVELQLHHEKFQNVRKKGKGHANYAATRFMMDFIQIQSKKQKASKEEHNKSTPQQKIVDNLKDLWDVGPPK